jgi:hypothetical protein
MGGTGDLELAVRAAPIYGGEIWRELTEFTRRFSPFRASSRRLPSVTLREHGIIAFCGDEGGSLETADPDVPLGPGLRVL